MLVKNYWYAIARGDRIGGVPTRVRALEQDLVIYRRASDGRVVVMSDVCPHRMASLALGRVEGDELRCPYHGWRFGSDGVCRHVPAHGPGVPPPRRARVDSYPVEERYGLVWAFLGDLPEAERPPLPALPEFGQPGWRAVWGEYTWNAGYTRVVENTIDIAHTPFVHANSFGNTSDPQMPAYKVEARPHVLEATVVLRAPTPKGLSRLVMGGASTNEVSLGITMPSVNRLGSGFANGWRIVLLFAHLPVDTRTTRTFFVQLRSFLRFRPADGIAQRFTLQILDEDRAVVESQRPPTVPTGPGEDLSTRSDALALAYRRALRSCRERGWELAPHDAAGAHERILLIASPARREPGIEGGWVLGERPTVGPGGARPALGTLAEEREVEGEPRPEAEDRKTAS